jgi:hypothetical protein
MDREQALAALMDEEFTALLRRWQGAIPPMRVVSQGTMGTTLWSVCHAMKEWLGPGITSRDPTNLRIVRLDPEHLCARITEMAREARMSRPQTMLAVLALIDRIVQADTAPGSKDTAMLWTRYLEESWLSKAWAGSFRPGERSYSWPPSREREP